MNIGKTTLLIPLMFLLGTISDLGTESPGYVVDGELIVATFVLCFGLWVLGYITGKMED